MAKETNYPQDTDKAIYLENYGMGRTLAEIVEAAKEKWPNVKFEDVAIEAEHRHVTCLTYDKYDATDYRDYIILSVN